MTTTITIQTSKANRKEIAEAFGQNQSAVRRIESMTQDITVTLPDAIDGSTTIAEQALALAQALQQVAYVVASANAEVPNADVLQAGAGLTITIGTGTITLALTVPITVGNGGTGLTSLQQYGVLVGNGVNAPSFATPGAAAQVLTSNGPSANPTFQPLPAGVQSIAAGNGINVSGAIGAVTVSLAAPVTIANGGTGSNSAAAALANLGALGIANNLSDLGSAATARGNLGLGTAATYAASAFLQAANNLSDLSSVSAAQSNLGLGTAAVQNVSYFLQTANNLSDLASASSARTNLGLGSMATQSSGAVSVTGGTVQGLSALAVGATDASSILQLHIGENLTGGTTGQAVRVSAQVQSDVTGTANMFNTSASTAAASFTVGVLNHYSASQGTVGSGSTVTTQQGFVAQSSLVGATNNYGFRGAIPSGTGRWNLYMDGSAANYVAGALQIGSTTNDGSGNLLQVNTGISINPSTTTTAPSAGGGGALPATPTGYFTINIGGTARKVAYY